MTYQAVRAFFEAPVIAAYAALTPPLPVYVDNQLYEDFSATTEFALLRLNFGLTTESTITTDLDWIRGSLVLEIYNAKGIGPGRGQTLITTGINALRALNPGTAVGGVRGKIGPITGPSFFSLDGQPHYLTRISAGFEARVVT